MISRFNSFSAECEVLGEMREVSWAVSDGAIMISGVASLDDAMKVIKRLELGHVEKLNDKDEQFLTKTTTIRQEFPDTDPDRIVLAVREAAARADAEYRVSHGIPDHAGQGSAVKEQAEASLRAQEAPKEAAKAEPPKASVQPAGAGTTSAVVASSSGASAPAAPSASEDLSAFGSFDKISDVVAEIRKRGNDDYPSILTFCKRLASLGDVCPAIDALGERMETRLLTHCAGKGVKGTPV